MKRIHHPHELFFQEEQPGAGVIQDVCKFIRRKPDVQRKQHRTRFQHAIICFQQAMAIGAQEGHAVAALHSCLAYGPCKAADALGKLRVSITVLTANYGQLRWKLLLRVSQETNRSKRNIHFKTFDLEERLRATRAKPNSPLTKSSHGLKAGGFHRYQADCPPSTTST